VVNSLFLLRIVEELKSSLFLQKTVDELKEMNDDANVTVLLLILLSSVASLMYKVMKLRTFPEVWREHSRLLREKAKLMERAERLKMEAQATVLPESEVSDVDSDVDTLSGDIRSDCLPKCTHGGPSNSAQPQSAAMPAASGAHSMAVLPLSTSADGAGVYSSQSAPSSLSQLPRVEVTTFEICMLPECGR
jgi:hypothetical protein